MVTNTRKYSHVKPVLQKLHWLPVKQRIHFKILATTPKCITGKAPEYLWALVHKTIIKILRSSNQLLLQMHVSKLKPYGEGTFSMSGVTLWNRLPEEVRNKLSLERFKLLLKSYGEGIFSVTGATLWNRLPEEVRNKPSLKVLNYCLKHICLRLPF